MQVKGEDKSAGVLKICAVCGDSALGYNFNAVTCESCKAFFRRNALKNKELRCLFKDNCHITLLTRKFCQKCRLAKCYAVGMKRELIMSEADKQKKRRKILANKAKFNSQLVCSPNAESTSSVESNFSDYLGFKGPTVETGIQTNLPCACSSSASPDVPKANAQIITNYSPGIWGGWVPLDLTQKKLLDDLLQAGKMLDAPVDWDIGLPGDEFKNASKRLIDVINLTAVAIRRLIQMCKKINGFKLLCIEDQMSLLKQGCTQMLLLKSISHYDPDKNSWKIPHPGHHTSQIRAEILKEARINIYEAHEYFVRSFDSRATHDQNVMYILIAIALFDPSKEQIMDRPSVIRHQEMYYNLLQRYLDSAYSPKESLALYQHLIMKMVELRHINEDLVKVYLDVNPSQVEPILIEIFDLKPH